MVTLRRPEPDDERSPVPLSDRGRRRRADMAEGTAEVEAADAAHGTSTIPAPGRPASTDGAPATTAQVAEPAPTRHRRFARGHLAAVSVGAAMAAGAWIGLATGLLIGSALGAAIAWFAGAILAWQQDLGLTLGVVRALLPFGDQAPMLRTLSNYWYFVIPGVALVSGLVGAVIAGLIGGLIAAAYNRSPRHATVLVELPAPEQTDPDSSRRTADGSDPGSSQGS